MHSVTIQCVITFFNRGKTCMSSLPWRNVTIANYYLFNNKEVEAI